MIATKRYMKKGWLISQMAHSLIGTYITIVTIIFIVKVLNFKNMTIQNVTIHTVFGFLVLALSIIVWLTGALGAIMGRFKIGFKAWNIHKEPHVRILKLHSLISRVNIMWGYVATTTGLVVYQWNFADNPLKPDYRLAIAN